jgi:GT2 family glycosyltransferase
MIENNCLRSLMSYGIGENTGIVGAKLLYDDDTVQHAGVIVGLGGVACHILIGNHKDDPGYQAYANVAREYTAVTAACLLVKREAFEAVGGLDEQLKVAFNDIDFCLKVREKGYRVIYNPYALLYHYESKSRGYEDTPEKIERFQGESLYLVEKWSKIMDEGDPHYNPNLSLSTTDFSIREN